ncbi:MAG: UpxY family transcription antiterminator [Bryobacteraceae bacterium]|nr:UpxY family transcription antiterminator [Bryobacteraceae bacterium]
MRTFEDGPWYAVHVKSRHEKLVATLLEGRGLDVFLPLSRTRRTWSDRVKLVDMPVFPGYVFASFERAQHLSVLQSAGVLRVVGFGDELTPVSPQELRAVARLASSGLALVPWANLSEGENIYLERGPLRGLEGIVAKVKGTWRLVVSVSLLQRAVAVEIDRNWVRPVASPRSGLRPIEALAS